MWQGSQKLGRIPLHAAIPKPPCEFSLQSTERTKLQACVYVLLKSKGDLRDIFVSFARLRYLISSLISSQKHIHFKHICTFVYSAFTSRMLAIHQQLKADESQEPSEPGEACAALLSFAKLLRNTGNGFQLAHKLLCLRSYAPGITFYLP